VTAQEHKIDRQSHQNGTDAPELRDDAGSQPVGLLPLTFESDYVAGAVVHWLQAASYFGETPPPSLQMIDSRPEQGEGRSHPAVGITVRRLGAG